MIYWLITPVLLSRMPTVFFNTVLPAPAISEQVLTVASADSTVDPANYTLFTQLDLAMISSELEDSAVVDLRIIYRGRGGGGCGAILLAQRTSAL
jgi:hypothetical protein